MNSKQKQLRGNTISPILLGMVVISVSFMLISNILANRMIQVGVWVLDAGALTFPITYVISDILSEVYGYKWSRRVAWMSAAINIIFVTFVFIATSIPAPEWFNATPFSLALKSSFRIVIASVVSYVIGDWVNDIIFEKMKEKNPSQSHFKVRAILSSVGGSLVDTTAFVMIAFLFTMPTKEMLPMILIGVAAKTVYEIAILPVTSRVLKIVQKQETIYNDYWGRS